MESPDDDDVVASSSAGQDLGRTEVEPVVGRTAWDIVHGMGATEHMSRVLRELDPVEAIALLAYGYVVWKHPDQSPGLLWFLSAIATYHVVIRPLSRLGLVWLVSRMGGTPQSRPR